MRTMKDMIIMTTGRRITVIPITRPLTDEIIEIVLSRATTMRIIRDLIKEATETLDEAKGKDMRKCQGIVYYGINHGPADRTAHKFI